MLIKFLLVDPFLNLASAPPPKQPSLIGMRPVLNNFNLVPLITSSVLHKLLKTEASYIHTV